MKVTCLPVLGSTTVGICASSYLFYPPFLYQGQFFQYHFCCCETGSHEGFPQTPCVAKAGLELPTPIAEVTGQLLLTCVFVCRHPYIVWHCCVFSVYTHGSSARYLSATQVHIHCATHSKCFNIFLKFPQGNCYRAPNSTHS